jgi:hypothetical protein
MTAVQWIDGPSPQTFVSFFYVVNDRRIDVVPNISPPRTQDPPNPAPPGEVTNGESPSRKTVSCQEDFMACKATPIWRDGQFYRDLVSKTYQELVGEVINQSEETLQALESGDPGAITAAVASLACEVGKACDGLKSAGRQLLDAGKKLFKKCCFVAGTLVLTANGLVPIEAIAEGDLVWSRDEMSGESAFKPVTGLIRRHDREIWELELIVEAESVSRVERFETTDDHPWRTSSGAWVPTAALSPGTAIERADGAPARVLRVLNTQRTAPTFNLEVAGFHTYVDPDS